MPVYHDGPCAIEAWYILVIYHCPTVFNIFSSPAPDINWKRLHYLVLQVVPGICYYWKLLYYYYLLFVCYLLYYLLLFYVHATAGSSLTFILVISSCCFVKNLNCWFFIMKNVYRVTISKGRFVWFFKLHFNTNV